MEHVKNYTIPEGQSAFLISDAEARNIMQGLELLHSKCMDNIQAVHPFDIDGNQLKECFRAKQTELAEQISFFRKHLTGQAHASRQ